MSFAKHCLGGFAVAVMALATIVPETTKADEFIIYSDEAGWTAVYHLDERGAVVGVRVGFGLSTYIPNPFEDDPPGPWGPWVKIQDAQKTYGFFGRIYGLPNPEDDDDPWGPIGPVVQIQKEFVGQALRLRGGPDPTPWYEPDPEAWTGFVR